MSDESARKPPVQIDPAPLGHYVGYLSRRRDHGCAAHTFVLSDFD